VKKDNWKIKVNGKGTPVSEIVSKVWKSRGIENPEAFLNPVGNLLPSTDLSNIEKAARTFYMMINMKAKFTVYADVDADGCSSAAIIYHYLTAHECECRIFINHKKEHGVKDYFFDINDESDCVIVVDSINNDMTQYEKIWAQGKQLIILDHHIPTKEIIDNAASLNLVSSAINYANPHLSGSGVTWKFVNYVDSMFGTNYAEDLIDLAAVGIIADVCSVGIESMENRELCDRGFKHIVNTGIKAVIGAEEMNSDSIAYSIAPLINAANRMNENELAVNLFLTDRSTEAKQIVKDLTKIKDKQKKLAAELFDNFENMIQDQMDNCCYYFFIDETYGTLGGLLATKATDKWKRPCIVVHDTPEGYAGSMRATGLADFRSIVNFSGMADCQGHENSAGIVINKDTFEQFREYIETTLRQIKTFCTDTEVDVCLERMQITPFLINKLREINRISGPGFPTITVLIENVRNYTVKKMSQGKHLCIEVPDMKFLSWNFNDWESVIEDGCMSAIGTLDESFFAGRRSIQMMLSDYVFELEPQKQCLW
jgi:single-stranded-DNA-specific exonuclease